MSRTWGPALAGPAWRPFAIAVARAVNTLVFLATAAYCLLAYSPFGYQQFLKPEVLPWIPDFLAVHAALFWLAWMVTLLTLKPYLQVRLTTFAEATVVKKAEATGRQGR